VTIVREKIFSFVRIVVAYRVVPANPKYFVSC
jgi:hypothetical protein